MWNLPSSLPGPIATQVRSLLLTAGQTFGIYFGGQVCGEGSPAADGSVSPAGYSEVEAHQKGPQGDGRGRVKRRLLGGNRQRQILYLANSL